jgi:hypothetical protein
LNSNNGHTCMVLATYHNIPIDFISFW